jgi:hypothetical protein
MTYNIKKFFLLQNSDAPSVQTISTTYTEITGSRCQVNTVASKSVLYKFNFYLSTIYTFGSNGNYDKPLIHIKLQKSNDDFSSNIEDIDGSQFNASGDTEESRDYFYSTFSPMFILENINNEYLRLVARSYSTTNRANLHRGYQFDGNSSSEFYFNTTLSVMEI